MFPLVAQKSGVSCGFFSFPRRVLCSFQFSPDKPCKQRVSVSGGEFRERMEERDGPAAVSDVQTHRLAGAAYEEIGIGIFCEKARRKDAAGDEEEEN